MTQPYSYLVQPGNFQQQDTAKSELDSPYTSNLKYPDIVENVNYENSLQTAIPQQPHMQDLGYPMQRSLYPSQRSVQADNLQQQDTAISELNPPFATDLKNSDVYENFALEKFLQTSDGDFKFDPATFDTTIPDVSSHLKRMSAARAMSPTTAEHGSIGQRSPFREAPQYAERQAAPLASAAQLWEQQENEAVAQELQYTYGKIPDSPKTIAPGDSFLRYDWEENLPYS